MMHHLIIDVSECDSKKLWDTKLIKSFLSELPRKINMSTLCNPVIIEDRKGLEEEQGITGFVILDESHLAIHTYPEKGLAYIDIFSCKEINEKVAKKFILEKFGNVKIKGKLMER